MRIRPLGPHGSAIETYRQKLATENVQQLQLHIQHLQLSKQRYTPAVKVLVGQLVAARVAASNAEGLKKAARDNLDALMKQMLKDYEQAINALLKKFGASFVIAENGRKFPWQRAEGVNTAWPFVENQFRSKAHHRLPLL